MPKSVYYSDVKIIKKSLKERVKSVFKFFLFFFIVAGCFISATYLSSALTVGNLGAFIVYGDTKITINEKKYYAVILGEYESKEEADRVALASTIQGASGYVWQDSTYWVIGSVYSSRSDAEKVVGNLKESSYKSSIKEITTPKTTLNFDMYSNENMDIVNKAIEVFDDVYSQLYNSSIKFDKGETNNLAISSEISSTRGEVKTLIVSVQNLLNIATSDLKYVQKSLILLDELLDQTIIKTIDNSATSYSLKNSIASVIRIKWDLFVELV